MIFSIIVGIILSDLFGNTALGGIFRALAAWWLVAFLIAFLNLSI